MKDHAPRPSIDGFTLKRQTPSGSTLGQIKDISGPQVPRQFLRPQTPAEASKQRSEILPRPEVSGKNGLSRSEIDESLRAVDEEPATRKNRQRKHKRWYQRKKLIVTGLVVLLLVGGGVFFASKFMSMASRVFSGNVLDLLGSGVELKKDSNGRTNVLLFGTSEDDAGHAGAQLTDSIMVLSIDKANKKASMVSMPRDMWTSYGQSPCCWVGCEGKINALYQCFTEEDDVTKGADALKSKVGEIFGFDIQYYVKVNYSVVRDLTTALGGVTVKVESTDSRGLYDYNTKLKLPNGPATLQGEQALAFVRARGDGGGYGFEGSNFVREQNQQKMIVGIRDKALSLGTLSNPAALLSIMDALGNNIRTNFSTAEVKTLANIGKDISGDQVTHINLNDGEKRVVTTGSYNGLSIVKPVAGIGVYTGIQSYIQTQMNGGSVESEDATITVLNGSSKIGVAATKQTELTQAGLLNITINDTAYTPKTSLVWYDTTGGKMPKTQAKLSSVLGKKPTGATLPSGVQSTADFVIILGD